MRPNLLVRSRLTEFSYEVIGNAIAAKEPDEAPAPAPIIAIPEESSGAFCPLQVRRKTGCCLKSSKTSLSNEAEAKLRAASSKVT